MVQRPASPAWRCLLLFILAAPAWGAPMTPDDSYVPACGGTLPAPPPGAWVPWSSNTTWGGSPVPGIGESVDANVTIPCGMAVLLDLPGVQVSVLNVLGALKFKDDPSLPVVNLTAAFVIIEGRLIIGDPVAQFSQQAVITLVPNSANNRSDYFYSSRAPADPKFPRNLGHKAFAVVGGQVDLHGLPGPASMLTWTKLGRTAYAGDTSIYVVGDVMNWPIGSEIVVAPTDFYPDQEDVRRIIAITKVSPQIMVRGPLLADVAMTPGLWRIDLDRNLTFNHFGDPFGVPDGFGGYIDETGEVGLLNRNILVTASDEPAPYRLDGGHFIVYMTRTKQLIEGVEFRLLGQQGLIGRYPLHFHFCGDQKGNSVVRKNLIRASKQRCVVIHGTFNIMVESNVAYNTFGHCYITEDGGETGNTFQGNLAVRTRTPSLLIPDADDNLPAGFWITNPNNNFINNAGAGSEDSAFWFEFFPNVRGLSLTWAKGENALTIWKLSTPPDCTGALGFWITNPKNNLINNAGAGSEDSAFWFEFFPNVRGLALTWAKVNKTTPKFLATMGTYVGNSGHSSLQYGLRIYPQGFTPRVNAYVGSPTLKTPQMVTIGNFNLWKNQNQGLGVHVMDHVQFVDSTFADNRWAIQLMEAQGIMLSGLRFVGVSKNNLGNPSNCQSNISTTCGPITGCRFPLLPGEQGRSVPYPSWKQSIYGVAFTENRQRYEDGSVVSTLINCTFSGFDNTCRPSAGIVVGTNREDYWNAGNGFKTVKFDASSNTNPVYLYPWLFQEADAISNAGEIANFFALRDNDGSIIGGKGGYVVANNPSILPPNYLSLCKAMPAANAWGCQGVCYRSVLISYNEPQFTSYPRFTDIRNITDGPRVLGDFSYIIIKRSDGATVTMEGNLRQYLSGNNFVPPGLRLFPATLLSGYTYEITLVAAKNNPTFVPNNIMVEFRDGPGCGQGVVLRFKGSTTGVKYSWDKPNTGKWAACTGKPGNAKYTFACVGGVQTLEVTLNPTLPSPAQISLPSLANAPGPCVAKPACGYLL